MKTYDLSSVIANRDSQAGHDDGSGGSISSDDKKTETVETTGADKGDLTATT